MAAVVEVMADTEVAKTGGEAPTPVSYAARVAAQTEASMEGRVEAE